MGRPKNTPEQFWQRVDKTGGDDKCWPWTGALTPQGYGVTTLNWKYITAHRAAYYYTHGEIEPGKHVCHRCDNPPCCNPAHLFSGTTQDNTADMVSKGRQSKGEAHSKALMPNRPRGEDNCNAVLTKELVMEARRLYTEERKSVVEIADQLGIVRHTMQKAILGHSWKHLPMIAQEQKRHFSKLTPDQVSEIRNLRTTTGATVEKLAHQFGISVYTCNDIVYYRTWKHLP